MINLKKEFLKLLEEDIEFRYTIAGYLGISEILRRLDKIDEHIVKLWENQNKLWEEVRSLREGQNKLWENQNKLWEEVRDMRSSLNRLTTTVDRLAITVERLTISVEEEAVSFIRYRLRNELGIEVQLDRIFIDTREINIYGVSNDVCVVGEATVRLGSRLVDDLLEKVELLKSRKPELLRPKIIKVIYADYSTPDALEYAKKKNVWVVKWSGDLTPRILEEVGL